MKVKVQLTFVAYCDVGLPPAHPATNPTLWHPTQIWCVDDVVGACGLQSSMGGQMNLTLLWMQASDSLGSQLTLLALGAD